ncbi:LrgB family protein [Corticibacter populi]|uniref:LrgB family protein n=1 Tax=Corticibacter populi TaxID=1550736 RepID=A0A3M6QVF2_9BURK|nr:LrgB family protein [Corticibacter populi]RMX06539.1 LrgB family protein [Corticibacter populi]RZS31897.1 putative murein hydrolase (TIGR00659 family) [Corticibacter populi]
MWLDILLWSVLTLAVYFVARRIYLVMPRWWTSPLLLAPAVLMLVMLALHVSYGEYIRGTHWLILMLGPVTVAFAVPIYEQRELLRRYWAVLLLGALVGSSVSLLSAWLLARGLDLSPQLQRSLMPRSVTTPFAVTVSDRLGGMPDLTSAFVIATGLCGAALGSGLLRYLRLRSGIARGALFGMGAHGAGVARAQELGVQEGTVAGLVMILAGLMNLALLPLVSLLLNWHLG